jgi:hypothetical protein
MASTINGTSTGNGGLISTGDDSGILNIQTNETTAITVDTSQRVGVNITTPNANFQVNGAIQVTGTPTVGSTGVGVEIGYGLVNASEGAIQAYNRSGSAWINMAYSALAHKFLANNSEAMRIDSSGNVGIGGTSLGSKFEVFQSTTPSYFRHGNGTYLNITTGAANGNVDIKFDASSGGYPAGTFWTGGSERMRINSGGQVNINTTGDTNALLVVNGGGNHALRTQRDGTATATQMAIVNGNGQVGSIQTSGTSTSYNTSSDYRLKENIVPMTGALAKVNALKPVNFKWKSDGIDGQGFIAHELQEIIPDAVVGEKDALDKNGNPEYQGIDTSFLVATLTAALQETKALIDTQAETITALTARIVALESKGTV